MGVASTSRACASARRNAASGNRGSGVSVGRGVASGTGVFAGGRGVAGSGPEVNADAITAGVGSGEGLWACTDVSTASPNVTTTATVTNRPIWLRLAVGRGCGRTAIGCERVRRLDLRVMGAMIPFLHIESQKYRVE